MSMKYKQYKKTMGGNEHQPGVSKLVAVNFEFFPKTFLLRGANLTLADTWSSLTNILHLIFTSSRSWGYKEWEIRPQWQEPCPHTTITTPVPNKCSQILPPPPVFQGFPHKSLPGSLVPQKKAQTLFHSQHGEWDNWDGKAHFTHPNQEMCTHSHQWE